uniref:Uncharacterized protein n=1 Tax=Schmidtea mediterranea TaxID=79327 RepID=I1ZIG9_SCHMD|nr:hypothetical protein [Schmidtea mediterranea]
MKSDLLFGSLTNGSNERQSPLGIEYCMYCGLHCLSIQMLLQHIHHCHLG